MHPACAESHRHVTRVENRHGAAGGGEGADWPISHKLTCPIVRKAIEGAGYTVPPDATRQQSGVQTIEVPIKGMDCTECTQHVQKAIAALSGAESAKISCSRLRRR